jgi:hypothetical protein
VITIESTRHKSHGQKQTFTVAREHSLGDRYEAHFTQGVKPKVQLKSSIPIGFNQAKGLTLGVKAEI